MSMKPLDYYVSDLVDQFSEGTSDQADLQEIGYVVYRQQNILQNIGTSESESNIQVFLDEVLEELTVEGKHDFLRDCLAKIVSVYNLHPLESLVEDSRIIREYSYKVVELMLFLESSTVVELLADCIPYVAFTVITEKEKFKKFLNLNYKEFLKSLEANRKYIPDFFYEFFVGCSKDNAISTLIQLVYKDKLAFHSKQITKGE